MYEMIATCPEETKETLASELKSLGATDIRSGFRMVSFRMDEAGYYRSHLCLRTASRLMLILRQCSVNSPATLFDQAKRIAWHEYLQPKTTFLVEGIQGDRGPGFMKSNEISKRVREAIESHFRSRKTTVPRVDLKSPKVKVVAHLVKGRLTISVDTSGKGLHKRGYQGHGHPAPAKETLAANILLLTNYDGSEIFFDPMCGSGTLAIEAAYLALNKAPLIHRKKDEFGFEHLANFNRQLWREIQQQVRDQKRETPLAPIYASDINSGYVSICNARAERARIAHHINIQCQDFFYSDAPADKGLLVTNLPYGERLQADQSDDEMVEFYKKIGDQLKQKYKGWRAALLVNQQSPYKFIGLKPQRKIALKNGSIPVKLLIFDLY